MKNPWFVGFYDTQTTDFSSRPRTCQSSYQVCALKTNKSVYTLNRQTDTHIYINVQLYKEESTMLLKNKLF